MCKHPWVRIPPPPPVFCKKKQGLTLIAKPLFLYGNACYPRHGTDTVLEALYLLETGFSLVVKGDVVSTGEVNHLLIF
ncbi:MAG: hypothetical protein C0609_00960 [Deltaproteobacteria bacterium]|nr:MAG: hypothetical protein C0609_00960 [Deltaproteobacteria bacterium]